MANFGLMTKEEQFEYICIDIENGKAARHAIKAFMSTQTFYAMLSEDEEKSKRYARACEARADAIFDEIIDIADNRGCDTFTDQNGIEMIDHAVIQRDKLRVDTRKWMLAKLQPKKYGDKLDVENTNINYNVSPSPEEIKKINEALEKKF